MWYTILSFLISITLANKIKKLNVNHNSLLLHVIDLLSTFQEVIYHDLSAGTSYAHIWDNSKVKAKITDTKRELEERINIIFKKTFGIIFI